MNRLLACLLGCSLSIGVSSRVRAAAPERDTGGPRAGAAAPDATEELAADGAFLAWTEPARTGSQRAVAIVHGGRAGLGNTLMGSTQLTLIDSGGATPPRSGKDFGLALRAGAAARPREEVKLDVGLQAQVLFQEDAGLDLALAVDYENEGFNLRPELVGALLAARDFGSVSLLLNAAYGHGVLDDERFGRVRLALMTPVTSKLRVGVDSSLAADLEIDDDEPPGEPELDLQMTPAATFVLGSFSLSAQAGVAVSKLRFESTRVGPAALVGIGAAF
jgi:hypothetical protein